MKIIFLCISLMFTFTCYSEEISPYKFTDNLPVYEIPASSRFVIKASDITSHDLIYYFSPPKSETYPIAILCGGSSTQEDICSIIHFHRYFLEEFLDLNVGVVTAEQRGVDGNAINAKEFMEHYTRSNRLKDHQIVVEHFLANPPTGWDGKFLFLGVSEGGPIVTMLTTQYPDNTLATINWSGAKDWSWREEFWFFLQELLLEDPECPHQIRLKSCDICLEFIQSRDQYDALMDAILLDPSPNLDFLGMTYKYHADALLYPVIDYKKIRTPFLVVAGTKDTIIQSSDAFVEKAKNAGVSISYLRVEDMDHYVRKRTDIINESFEWLRNQLNVLKPQRVRRLGEIGRTISLSSS